jgi:hypothetical protein
MGPPYFAEADGDLRGDFFSRRCFLRATPLLPGHKLAFAQERESQKQMGKFKYVIDRNHSPSLF